MTVTGITIITWSPCIHMRNGSTKFITWLRKNAKYKNQSAKISAFIIKHSFLCTTKNIMKNVNRLINNNTTHGIKEVIGEGEETEKQDSSLRHIKGLKSFCPTNKNRELQCINIDSCENMRTFSMGCLKTSKLVKFNINLMVVTTIQISLFDHLMKKHTTTTKGHSASLPEAGNATTCI